MNFLDTYDIPTSSTPTPENQQQEQSLNDEVTQVVGQLTRFWGGFRKQSQSAFQAARKDLGQVVSQAQKEITRLTTDAPNDGKVSAPAVPEPSERSSPPAAKEPQEEQESDEVEEKDIVESFNESEAETHESTSTSTTPTPTPSSSTTLVGHARTASQSIFSRLQATLPPNLVSTVQNQIPESLKHAPGSIDFANLKTTLTSEFQRVQGITRAQAEEYVHKSEELLKEAGEFLKDAVKVLPPEEGSSGSIAPAGVLWDGTDIWMLPDVVPTSYGSKGKERASSSSGRPSVDGLRAVATRAESLLKQLRHDPEVIRVDPAADERAKVLYDAWIREELDTKEGGIGGKEWATRIEKALSDPVDGNGLKATMDTLVPSAMASDTFWTRYFFRVHQVEREEQRRKALIQGTVDNDDDFSWEDDEDDTTSPTTAKPSLPPTELIKSATPTTVTPASPTSSEDVDRLAAPKSATSSPEVVSNAGGSKTDETPKDLEEDGDSDWE